jgi:hypothetical protein
LEPGPVAYSVGILGESGVGHNYWDKSVVLMAGRSFVDTSPGLVVDRSSGHTSAGLAVDRSSGNTSAGLAVARSSGNTSVGLGHEKMHDDHLDQTDEVVENIGVGNSDTLAVCVRDFEKFVVLTFPNVGVLYCRLLVHCRVVRRRKVADPHEEKCLSEFANFWGHLVSPSGRPMIQAIFQHCQRAP